MATGTKRACLGLERERRRKLEVPPGVQGTRPHGSGLAGPESHDSGKAAPAAKCLATTGQGGGMERALPNSVRGDPALADFPRAGVPSNHALGRRQSRRDRQNTLRPGHTRKHGQRIVGRPWRIQGWQIQCHQILEEPAEGRRRQRSFLFRGLSLPRLGDLAAEFAGFLPAEGISGSLKKAFGLRVIHQHSCPGIDLDEGIRAARQVQTPERHEHKLEELLQASGDFSRV